MTIRITQANVSGFTGSSGGVTPEEPEEAQFYIPAATELVDNFSIDLIVEGVYPDSTDPESITYTYQYATDVRSSFDWASIGITFTKLNAYTVRLTGPATNIFINQFYRFKLADYSEKNLPATTTEPFFGLIQYQMPSPTFVLKTYNFEADLPADSLLMIPAATQSFTMSQWFSWRFQVAEANIAAINARGLK
jgi:hypothetical protein